jgi:hypothetical protein
MFALQKHWIALALCAAAVAPTPGLSRGKAIADVPASQDILWGEQITLTPPGGAMGRYPRILKLTQGPDQGDILLSYQTEAHGGDFMMYRSSDQGRSWGDPILINQSTDQWYHASCNIIELSDGRLLMSMQRRVLGSGLGRDYFIDVKYSSDGGRTWGEPQQVFHGGNWEGRPFEVPNDLNGDGTRDLYLFFTQHVIDTKTPAKKASRTRAYGRAVSFVASYDGGVTWSDRNPERFTGAIIHRDYREGPKMDPTAESGGGMPQPFLLPDNRVGFVVEELGKRFSPLIIANDPGDWDWAGPDFQGPWTSADYDGVADDNVYPSDKANVWEPQQIEFSKAPYIAALPDGRYVMASQTPQIVRVWVGDAQARNFRPQELPFGMNEAVFPAIEPISDTEVLVAGGSYNDGDNFIWLRIGKLAD